MNAVTGAVAETCTSLPWGDNLQCTGTDQSPLHFTGKQRDSESNLDNFFGARYNSSALGRLMSADPIGILSGQPGDPQGLNLYTYVQNNPVNAVRSRWPRLRLHKRPNGDRHSGRLLRATRTTAYS